MTHIPISAAARCLLTRRPAILSCSARILPRATGCGRPNISCRFWAFALGVVAAEIVKRRYKKRQSDINIHWRQIVVLVEIVLLIAAAFLPQSMNTTVNIMISFICAMQVESFRKVRGSAFATTMCTGNLRSGTEQLVIWAQTGDRNAIRKTRNYYSIILFFILGGAIGALTTARIGEKALLLTCIPLSLVFTVMFVEEEHTLEAEETAGKER